MSIRHTLRWGSADPIELDLDDAACIRPLGAAASRELAVDAAAATARALAAPLDFPSIAQATVAGDHVAIAVGHAIPQVASVVRGVLNALTAANVESDHIAIVVADAATAALVASIAESCKVVVHNPREEDQLVYVGEMRGDVTLRLNRQLCEADLVLPIGCAQPVGTLHASAFECLFPLYSDLQSQAHYAHADKVHDSDLAARRDEAGWLLGTSVAVQVVAQHGGQVAEVLVGTPQHCQRVASGLASELWQDRYPRSAKLVVASVTEERVSWQCFADVLAMCDQLRSRGGGVALCIDLANPPGRSLGRLIGEPDHDRVLHYIEQDSSPDTAAALALVQALEHGPIYLLSNLDPDTVEDLGMAPIANAKELSRLVSRNSSYIVIDEAEHSGAQLVATPQTSDIQ